MLCKDPKNNLKKAVTLQAITYGQYIVSLLIDNFKIHKKRVQVRMKYEK